MARPFDSFVIFAEMRTGSNLLEASVNALTGVTCHGEAFNPALIGYPKRSELLGMTMAERDADPMALLARIRKAPGLNGFRYFHDHDPRILQKLLNDKRCAKIILTRNPVESYVSLKIARATGQWKLGDARHRKEALAEFDAAEFEAHLDQLQSFQQVLMHGMQSTGQTGFYIDYEDARDLAVLNGLAEWLGAEGRIEALPDGLVPQNPEALDRKVADPAAMERSLARLDRFNLSRTPNFEPRRGPNVPGFVASREAGLLYMPMKPGADAGLRDWLAGFGGLEEGFSQKTLRQWKKTHPGHRSFTVLRHPLMRAHHALALLMERDWQADLRAVLRDRYKLPLPPEGKPAPQDPADYAALLLAFLRFLKANLADQTSLKVEPVWASQTALLQGFAQFAVPDLIIREERLAEDLAYLTRAAGVSAPSLPALDPDTAVVPLAQMVTEELQAAARDAYARDFMLFGFEGWRP
jgi:LPS sulfotransferase NodH